MARGDSYERCFSNPLPNRDAPLDGPKRPGDGCSLPAVRPLRPGKGHLRTCRFRLGRLSPHHIRGRPDQDLGRLVALPGHGAAAWPLPAEQRWRFLWRCLGMPWFVIPSSCCGRTNYGPHSHSPAPPRSRRTDRHDHHPKTTAAVPRWAPSLAHRQHRRRQQPLAMLRPMRKGPFPKPVHPHEPAAGSGDGLKELETVGCTERRQS